MDRDRYLEALDEIFIRIGRQFRHKVTSAVPLTLGQFAVLRALSARERMTMGELADVLGVSYAAATGIVDRLENSGIIQRNRSHRDRRMVWVELSAKGTELTRQMRENRRVYLQTIMGRLSESDLATLVRLLNQVAERGESDGA